MMENSRPLAVDDAASKESSHEKMFKGYDFREVVDFGSQHSGRLKERWVLQVGPDEAEGGVVVTSCMNSRISTFAYAWYAYEN